MDSGAFELHKLCVTPYTYRNTIVLSVIFEFVIAVWYLYGTIIFIKAEYWFLAALNFFVVVVGRILLFIIPPSRAFFKQVIFLYLEPEYLRLVDRSDNTLAIIPKNQVAVMRICMVKYTEVDHVPWKFIFLAYDFSHFQRQTPRYSYDFAVTDRYIAISYKPEYVEILQKYLNVPVIDEVEEEKKSAEFERNIARQTEDERRRQIAQARAVQDEIDRRQEAALQEAFLREQENAVATDCVVLPENGTDEEENTDAP